jgi:hypothetical protein
MRIIMLEICDYEYTRSFMAHKEHKKASVA